MTGNSDSSVRAQYEALPYPHRDPTTEMKHLERTWLDDLPMINHYCFGGKQSFAKRFRALVAGGGTGDGTIFLAEQLKHTDARIVHLDFSKTSLNIAKARAAVRGLTNIDWINDSLLNLPQLDLEPFDYINCVGVLHHLEEPDAGLKALRSVLKPDGAMGLMVYAQYGRTGIYQLQEMLRKINEEDLAIPGKIDNAKAILGVLPKTNWFRRGEDNATDHLDGDAGIFDLLLHSQDRAYSVGELFDWLEGEHSLHLEFTSVQRGRSAYLSFLYTTNKTPLVLARLADAPRRKQYEIGELFSGQIITHDFYATNFVNCAPYGDPDYVPLFFHEPLSGPDVSKIFRQSHGRPFLLTHAYSGVATMVSPGKYISRVLNQIDGRKSFQEIFDAIRSDSTLKGDVPTNEELFNDFSPIYKIFNSIDRLLLQHRDLLPRSASIPAL